MPHVANNVLFHYLNNIGLSKVQCDKMVLRQDLKAIQICLDANLSNAFETSLVSLRLTLRPCQSQGWRAWRP